MACIDFDFLWSLTQQATLADDSLTTHGENSPAIIGDYNKVIIYVINPDTLKTLWREPGHAWEPGKPSGRYLHVEASDSEGIGNPKTVTAG